MNLPVTPPIDPMLAELSHEVPEGDYLYEPKWDGFRAIVFRDGDEVRIDSRNQRPLGRYFPELIEGLARELPPRIVVDGEIVIVGERGLDFEALQQRLHTAASRVNKLAKETPAQLVVFDLIALGDEDLRATPLHRRRALLEEALAGAKPPLHLTPASSDPAVARDWFTRFEGAGLDGIMAKPRDLLYVEGKRVMTKVKHQRTADCVVGGYRMHKDGKGVGSLLLGCYDDAGNLGFLGVASGFAAKLRTQLEAELAPYRDNALEGHPWAMWASQEAHSGEHRLPGGQSRWSGDKDMSFVPIRAERVAEVAYDHLQGNRFRHSARFVRWRPDRDAASCLYAQLDRATPEELGPLMQPR